MLCEAAVEQHIVHFYLCDQFSDVNGCGSVEGKGACSDD